MDIQTPLKYMSESDLRQSLLSLNDVDIAEAIDIATFAHAGVKRSTLRPNVSKKDNYIIHPMRNAMRAYRNGADIDQLIIIILHDTVEDAAVAVKDFFNSSLHPFDLYRIRFGDRVANGVAGLTVYGDYHSHVYQNCRENDDVFLAKVVDLKDNAGSLKYMENSPRRIKLINKYQSVIDILLPLAESNKSSFRNYFLNELNNLYSDLLALDSSSPGMLE